MAPVRVIQNYFRFTPLILIPPLRAAEVGDISDQAAHYHIPGLHVGAFISEYNE
jgi:hypothetical protein